MITGEQIKKAIKSAGFSLEDASTMLNISRQTLYINLNKAVADKKFVDNVKKNLGAYLTLEDKPDKNPTNDFISGENEPEIVQGLLKDQLIKSQQQTIEALNRTIETMEREIERLQQQLQETLVHQQHGTGKRRSA